MKRRLKRVTSLLCVFALCVGLLPASGIWNAAGAESGINGYQATMQADAFTEDGWAKAFDVDSSVEGAVSIDGTYRSAALNGKVWADKSVTADETNKEFNVTLSALGQTFASKTTSQTEVAFDVMFVLDTSGSMNSGEGSKAQVAVNAVNSAMKALLDGSGKEHNRVGIVTFGDTMSNDNIRLPLDHYSHTRNSDNYIEYKYTGSFWEGYEATLAARSSNNQEYTTSFSMNSNNTYTQGGIAWGINQLIASSKPDDGLVHYPVVILLTDGEPNRYSSNYESVDNSGENCGTSNNQGGATGGNYTVRTALAYKTKLTNVYQERYQDADLAAKFYTIGQGISDSNDYAKAVLNPTASNITAAGGNLKNALFPRNTTVNDTFSYADAYYGGEMTEEQLTDVFNSIIDSITTTTGGVSVGEATGGRNKMTFFETLGDGVQFTGSMTLTVPTYTVDEKGQMQRGESRVYTLTPYASTTVSGDGGLEEGVEITSENGPAYVKAGGVVKFKPTKVNNTTLDSSNEYDKAALNELSITVRLLSSGKRQMQVDIPPKLMAYNVLNTETENGQSTSTYYVSNGPVRLSYSVKMLPDAGSGSYLIGEPSQTYMHFIPSSAQTVEEGKYDMPYYWLNGQFANDPARVEKTGGVTGASDYVSLTQMGQNNDVYIYLGNNGLYTLEGKDLTFHLFWDDSSNQDGQRFKNIHVQLYREKVGTDSIQNPDSAPTDAEEYGEPVSLGLSNVKDDDANVWEQVFSDLKVYSADGKFYRYWLQFVRQEGEDDNRGYTVDINKSGYHQNGVLQKDDSTWWFCFDVGEGLLTDAKLDVKFSRAPETIDYTVEKKWVGGDGTSATMQLMANGAASGEAITLSTADNWTHTWEDLPKYDNGKEITYSVVETAYAPANQYTIEYDIDDSSKKMTVTNTKGGDSRNFAASVVWEDNNNQDGVRPQSVWLKLKAEGLDDDALVDLSASDSLMDAGDLVQTFTVGTDTTVTWSNIPRYNNGEAIKYKVVELDADGKELSKDGSLDNNYKVTAYTTIADGYMTVTNTHTPETVDITINKEWIDSENQDGIRPTGGVSGVLYEKAGDGVITPLRSFAITGDSVTISGLPKYESGQEITYYVSENAVSGYTLSVDDAIKAAAGNTTVYQVPENGEITLTNTHTPATQDYTASFTWNDNENRDGQRPDSFTVTLTGTVSGQEDKEYEFTLTLSSGTITDVTAPYGINAEIENGSLEITGLPSYDDGKMISYTMGNVNIGNGYTSAIDRYTASSADFTLSYTSAPQTLGFTKVWNDENDSAGMRPSAGTYARYLTLKADGEEVNAWPTVTQQGANYVVTYSNLPKWNEEGEQIEYTVTESGVPNYTADSTSDGTVELTADKANTITNTYSAEVYGTITVTKVWNDADGRDKRPEIPDLAEGGVDPLNIRLYETYGSQIDPDQGIRPDSITDNRDNTWTYTWNDVPKTDSDGSTIYYTAYENQIPDGYTKYSERDNNRFADIDADGQARSTIVNTLDGTSASTGTLTIEKVWADKDYENSRPDELSFTVVGTYNGSENDISRTVTMSKSTDWSAVEVTGLPLTVNGEKVTYTVTENDVPAGYTPSYKGNGVTLADASGNEATVTVTNTFAPDQWKLTYSANGGVNPPTDDKTYTPALNTATIAGPGKMSYDGYTFLGWTKEIHGVVTAAADVPSEDELYTEDETLLLNSDTTLYAVWAVDSNGDNVPDYDQKQITVNVVSG